MEELKTTWSLTIGNGGENHKGMEFLGNIRKKGEGWNIQQLLLAKDIFEKEYKKNVELYNLTEICLKNVKIPEKQIPKNAYLLVVRNYLTIEMHLNMIKELKSYEWDRKYWDIRRKRVLNKLARANVCYGIEERKANYNEGKGTIIGFEKSPLVHESLKNIEFIMKEQNLIVEGNQYDNIDKNGIGAHGDTERVCVACLRVGASMPIKFGYFWNCLVRGETTEIILNGGDLYIMSEEAVGAEWLSKNKWVLRHCAGANKYLKMKGECEPTCYPNFD